LKIKYSDIESFKKDIRSLIAREYEETIQNLYIDPLKNTFYPGFKTDRRLITLIKDEEASLYNIYKYTYKLIKKAMRDFEHQDKDNNNLYLYLSNFKKHCTFTDEIAQHIYEGKFLEVYDNHKVTHAICVWCKKVYLANSFINYCYECEIEYCSDVLAPEEQILKCMLLGRNITVIVWIIIK
jgi:hypothetical protein